MIKFAKYIAIGLSVLAITQARAQYVNHELASTEWLNKFKLIDDTLRCVTNKADSAYGYMPCLRVGDIFMNFSLSNVKKMYGEVDMVQDDHNGHVAHIFFLPNEDKHEHPYLAVMTTDDKIMSLEMSGTETSKKVEFSGLKLGDKQKKIVSILGEPSKVTPEDKYMHWDYDPFPFYLLLENGKLHSVTVDNDGGGVSNAEGK